MSGDEDEEEDEKPSAPAKPSDVEESDAMLEALWTRVLEAWDDDKPHQAILGHAIDKQLLPILAGRYRKLQEDPEKGARAKKKLDGIVIAATQMMLATKTPPREKLPWQWTAYAVAFFVVVIAFLAWKLRLMYGR